MLNNHTQEIRECYQQAAHCVQQAEAQNDPKVKKQFWSLHGAGYCWRAVTWSISPQTTQTSRSDQGQDYAQPAYDYLFD